VLMISLTGSAIVFRNELYTALWPGPRTVAITGPRLTHAQLRDAAHRAFPHYSVSWIWDAKQPNQAVEIWLMRKGRRKERLFNPFTGEDLGESRPYSIQFLAWLADLHINLLAGPRGRVINGIGAICVVLLAITGAVLWWPGVRSWQRALVIRRGSTWKRFNWDLHSVVGFWLLPLMLMFGIVGIYAGFPRPFQAAINKIAPLEYYRPLPEASIAPAPGFVLVDAPSAGPPVRPRLSAGDKIVRWFSYLHFGNFGGWLSKVIWVLLGLAPAFLFVTGFLMWWNRVLSPGARRARAGR